MYFTRLLSKECYFVHCYLGGYLGGACDWLFLCISIQEVPGNYGSALLPSVCGILIDSFNLRCETVGTNPSLIVWLGPYALQYLWTTIPLQKSVLPAWPRQFSVLCRLPAQGDFSLRPFSLLLGWTVTDFWIPGVHFVCAVVLNLKVE